MARKNTTTKKANFNAIAAGIKEALINLDGARGKADGLYKQAAAMLDAAAPNWPGIRFNVKEQAENAPSVVREAREVILAAAKESGVKSWLQVWQNIQRWSAHYTGSQAKNPDVIASQKAAKAANKAVKGEKEKPETTGAEPIADMVTKNPQFTRIVLSHLIAGLQENKGKRKAAKVSTTAIDALIESLEDAAELATRV
jgi:hypothetical protein